MIGEAASVNGQHMSIRVNARSDLRSRSRSEAIRYMRLDEERGLYAFALQAV
jgi:hypothetical protein